MVLAPNHDSGSSARVPLVLGGDGPRVDSEGNAVNIVTEIYDPEAGSWANYDLLEYTTWNTFGCLTAFNDDVYAITRGGVRVLHTNTWDFEELSEEVPEFLQPVTKCSTVEIDGQIGMYYHTQNLLRIDFKVY